MHMADALVSPAVGGAMWVASAGLIAYSAKRVGQEADDRKIPLMGVLGAFIFAAQMINFAIPGTGSSGHLGGGMILSVLLGPYAGFLVMASVLVVQALFFADGGLLALGCNIFNMGFFTSFAAFPLIYRNIAGENRNKTLIITGSLIASIVALQLGAFSVVLQTYFSGITELPFKAFLMLMQPIHLGIGIVEGLITSAVVLFIAGARPEILKSSNGKWSGSAGGARRALTALTLAAIMTGGFLSWFASSDPDGLEWSVFRVSGKEGLENRGKVHGLAASIQEAASFLPDYGFMKSEPVPSDAPAAGSCAASDAQQSEQWPAVDAGTSVAGLVGGLLVFLAALLAGIMAGKIKQQRTGSAK